MFQFREQGLGLFELQKSDPTSMVTRKARCLWCVAIWATGVCCVLGAVAKFSAVPGGGAAAARAQLAARPTRPTRIITLVNNA